MKFKQIFVAMMLLSFLSTPASAITAGELLKEDSKYISNYIAGLADMYAYTHIVAGNKARGDCVYEWYYRTEGVVSKVYSFMEKYPDKWPEAIFIVLARRACPK